MEFFNWGLRVAGYLPLNFLFKESHAAFLYTEHLPQMLLICLFNLILTLYNNCVAQTSVYESLLLVLW